MTSNKICSICLEEILDEKNVIQLQCRHKFHDKCLHKYFDHNNKKSCHCPLCRQNFNELNLKDRKPLNWTLRNRVIKMDLEYKNNKIDSLINKYFINLSKKDKIIDKIINEILDEIRNYIKHLSIDYFLINVDKKHLLSHLKIITRHIIFFIPLYKHLIFNYPRKVKRIKNKKIKIVKTDYIYLIHKVDSRKYVKKSTINKIYKSINNII